MGIGLCGMKGEMLSAIDSNGCFQYMYLYPDASETAEMG